MKIEAGKFYRTRDGDKRGPMRARTQWWDGAGGGTERWPFACDRNNSYRLDGTFKVAGEPDGYDLVAEWDERAFMDGDPQPEPPPPFVAVSDNSLKVPAGADWREPATPAEESTDVLGFAPNAYTAAAVDALAEVRRAKSMWPGNFNSAHEGFAIAL